MVGQVRAHTNISRLCGAIPSLAFKVSPLNWVSCLILLKVLFPTVLKIFADWIGVEGSIGARDLTFHFGSRIQYLSQSQWFSIYRFQDCFTYLDRGFVFQMISYYSEQFKDSDTQVMLCCTLTISIKMIMVSLKYKKQFAQGKIK